MAITVEILKHLIAVCIIFWTCAYPAMSETLNESSVAKTHQQWMYQYGRYYVDDAEKEKRLKIFMENLKYIENFNNAQNNGYKLGLNQFADLTKEEFLASYTGLKISRLPYSSKMASVAPLHRSEVPTSIDWREQGAVTDIKDQGQCGCCWAFSAVAAIEGIVKIKTGKLISLSEQQMLDCATQDGCDEGLDLPAFAYVKRNQGIARETDYPYKAVAGKCQNKMTPAAQIRDFEAVAGISEEQLLQAVANQPVSVPFSVGDDFYLYKKGVYKGGCGTEINHEFTIIGYGTSKDGTKYWLIKNSWGKSWGEGGYMKLLRDSGDPDGHCGIAKLASYPTM